MRKIIYSIILLSLVIMIIGNVSALGSFIETFPSTSSSTATPGGNDYFGESFNTSSSVLRLDNVTVAAPSTPSKAYLFLQNASNSTQAILLSTSSFSGTISLVGYNLSKNSTYWIVVGNDAAGYNAGQNATAQPYPINWSNNNFVKWNNGGHILTAANTIIPTGDWKTIISLGITNISSIDVTLNSPSNNSGFISLGNSFNATINSQSFQLINATLFIWNYSGSLIFSNQTNITGFISKESIIFGNVSAFGKYYWNVLACGNDSSGYTNCSMYPSNYTFTSGWTENSQSFNSTTFDSSVENYDINITFNTSYYNGIYAIFVYNGTQTNGTKNGNNYNVDFSITQSVPSVQSSTIKSFYWIIGLYNGTGYDYFNSTTNQQTINPVSNIQLNGGKACPTGFNTTYYYNIKDEINFTIINSTINFNVQYGYGANNSARVLNGTLTGVNDFVICINNSQPTYNIGYGEFQYTGHSSLNGLYNSRRFYLFSGSRSTNIQTNGTIFLLNSVSSTPFQMTLYNSFNIPQSADYLSLLRWYPDLNIYQVVDMGKTDTSGQTILNIQTQTVDYRIAAYYQNGSLIRLFDSSRFTCSISPCPYSLYLLNNQNSNLYNLDGFADSLTFNKTTKVVTYIWTDSSQATTSINVTVYQYNPQSTNVLCSEVGIGYTGLITCDLSAYSGSASVVVYRKASPLTPINNLQIDLSQLITEVFGGKTMVLFLAIILFGFATLVGAAVSPIVGLIFGLVGLFPIVLLGGINYGIFTGICVLAGILIHFWRRT